MTMTLSGDGTITGLVAGGLPDATITTDELAAGAALNNAPNSVGFRNRLINSDMRIDQRNAGASVTITATVQYTLDRWRPTSQSSLSVMSCQQVTDAPAGFVNSLKMTSLASTTPGASETYALFQAIEGNNIADLGWGTANAKTVTLSFWVRSSVTGTYSGAISNSAQDRSYPYTYTISTADTWEYKTVTIAGDTTGTWLTDNGIGIRLWLSLGNGANLEGTAGAWAAANYRAATGEVNWVATNGATWYITGVQLEVGSVATPFERRPFGTELALCQRYYEVKSGAIAGYASGSGAQLRAPISYSTTKRAAPTNTFTVSSSSPSGGTFAFAGTGASDVGGTVVAYTANGLASTQFADFTFTSVAEL